MKSIKDNIINIYNKTASTYAERHQKPSFHLADFVKLLKPGQKVLDAGCGHGFNADYMTKKGLEIIGVDLSPEMIKLAKKQNPKIDFQMADMRELEYPNHSFDAIVASFSLIHLPKKDVPEVFKKFNQFLKPGGLIYIGIQEGKSRELMQPSHYNKNDRLFLNIMSQAELASLLESAGFKIIKKYFRKFTKKELPFNKVAMMARKK